MHESLPMISRNVRSSMESLNKSSQKSLVNNKRINVELRSRYGIIPIKKNRKIDIINDYVDNTIKAEEEDIVEFNPVHSMKRASIKNSPY